MMSDDFSKLQTLFCNEIGSRQEKHAEKRCRALLGVRLYDLFRRNPEEAEALINESRDILTAYIIARLLDGYSISKARKVLKDAAAEFAAYHKAKAKGIR